MSEIDEINPSEDTIMTDQLIRIFKSEGCSPTECHACGKEIKLGEIFKLVPHPKTNYFGNIEGDGFIDEMCCKDCETVDLNLRDKRLQRDRHKLKARQLTGAGGFSRPSKQVAP